MNKDWSLKDLGVSLKDQLAGRYVRHRDHWHGILLFVQRERRPMGWLAPDEVTWWSFEQVMQYLQEMADELAALTPESPQVTVSAIDVA